MESSRKLTIFTYATSSPEGSRSTNKNKNNNTWYLWGSFPPELLLTHPFYLFCVLGGKQGPRAWEVSSGKYPLYHENFLEGLHWILHSFIHLFMYIIQQALLNICCVSGTVISLGGGGSATCDLFSESPSPPGSYTIMFLHRLWNDHDFL